MNFGEIGPVSFPEYDGRYVNMMPIIFGDINTLPKYLRDYNDIINRCAFKKGTTVYLTIHESMVEKGKTQRGAGIHTDATGNAQYWGGNNWGGNSSTYSIPKGSKDTIPYNVGIFIASSDGNCNIYDTQITDSDNLGGIKDNINAKIIKCKPNNLYWMTDRTPHEAIPVKKETKRQFFRLVSENISVWYSKHNTANPFGIKPNCRIDDSNKFENSSTKLEENDDMDIFTKHLEEASKIVAKWPAWKQKLLGGEATEN
jgi:hypothetical protein